MHDTALSCIKSISWSWLVSQQIFLVLELFWCHKRLLWWNECWPAAKSSEWLCRTSGVQSSRFSIDKLWESSPYPGKAASLSVAGRWYPEDLNKSLICVLKMGQILMCLLKILVVNPANSWRIWQQVMSWVGEQVFALNVAVVKKCALASAPVPSLEVNLLQLTVLGINTMSEAHVLRCKSFLLSRIWLQ